MNAAMLLIVSLAACGECRRADCGACSKPDFSLRQSWHSFWCNLSKSCDCDRQPAPWPLEYPGARARGWQAEGVAVTRETPINVGPHAVPVEFDQFGIPRVIRRPEPLAAPNAPEPIVPPDPFVAPARHISSSPAQSRFRFVAD